MYHYENGSVRWRKFSGKGDIRAYRQPKGWCASADLFEYHPITGEFLGRYHRWIKEEVMQ